MDIRGARRWQTLSEATRLIKEVNDWVAHRKDVDIDADGYRGRYETQLAAISSEVLHALERIQQLCANDAVEARTQGQVCKDYNLHDQRLVWIRYAWEYFRHKLDQRDDDALKSVLEAADEVSWSCYSVFFRSTNMPVPPAPIPYIEYDYVPSALRTGQTHVLNRKPGIEAGPLKDYFLSLPVPLLRLPPVVVVAPWSLSLICHEVGHLLQAHLEPDLVFFAKFAALVSAAVKEAGGTEEDQKKWSTWSPEVFADLCLAITAGPWSVWAVAPWVLTSDGAMNEPLEKYPPPLVRLQLLDRFSQMADLPSAEEIFTHLAISGKNLPIADAVSQIARQVFTINGKARTLSAVLNSSPAMMKKGGRIQQWSQKLLNGGEIISENDPTAARDATIAATRAHFLATQNEGDLGVLRDRALPFVRACSAKGVRAGTAPPRPAKTLSDCLFDLRDEELLRSASSENGNPVL